MIKINALLNKPKRSLSISIKQLTDKNTCHSLVGHILSFCMVHEMMMDLEWIAWEVTDTS